MIHVILFSNFLKETYPWCGLLRTLCAIPASLRSWKRCRKSRYGIPSLWASMTQRARNSERCFFSICSPNCFKIRKKASGDTYIGKGESLWNSFPRVIDQGAEYKIDLNYLFISKLLLKFIYYRIPMLFVIFKGHSLYFKVIDCISGSIIIWVSQDESSAI